MAKMNKRVQIQVLHLLMLVVVGFLVYINMNTIANFAKQNEIISAVLFVVIMAAPAYIHCNFILKRRKKK